MIFQLEHLMHAVLSRFDGWLYNAALAKMIYLIDMESVRVYGEQVTDINWVRNNYGPFVWDIIDCAQKKPEEFRVEPNGEKRKIISVCEHCPNLPEGVDELVDRVKEATPDPKKSFLAFKEAVYQTPPMLLSRGNGDLNLKEAIESEKEANELFEMLDTPEWHEAFEYLAAN